MSTLIVKRLPQNFSPHAVRKVSQVVIAAVRAAAGRSGNFPTTMASPSTRGSSRSLTSFRLYHIAPRSVIPTTPRFSED